MSMFALLICLAAGIQPIITSSSDKKLETARALGNPGAVQTINYTTHPDWDKQALHLTSGRGVDIVVDNVGPTAIAKAFSSLARGGLISLVGFLGGFNVDEQPNVLGPVLLKSARLRFVTFYQPGSLRDILIFKKKSLEVSLRARSMSSRLFAIFWKREKSR